MMPGPDGEECKGCYYWEGDYGDWDEGECVIEHRWTPKKSSQWCGEYKSREVTCVECRGEGKQRRYIYGGKIVYSEEACSYCKGIGKITNPQD